MHYFRVLVAGLLCLPAIAQPRPDPRISSLYPFTGSAGAATVMVARGTGLAGARAVSAPGAPFTVAVEGVEQEPAGPGKKAATDLVRLRVEIPADTKPGSYPIRLITAGGVTNALPVRVAGSGVTEEPPGLHETQETAVAVTQIPALYAGRLAQRGEADYYSFRAEAGQTLTFEVISGFPQIAAGGSAATIAKFDPALTIYERSGSWFDAARLQRIAYNDEPEWVFGKPTDAHLVHRFEKAGEYVLRIEAFAGQGGPDYSYELKIAPGEQPPDHAPATANGWDERGWTRRLDAARLQQLARRGGKDGKDAAVAIETYRAAPEPANFKIPGTLEGALTQPGETHRARFSLSEPADIAIEIETPAASPPFFNPIFRLLREGEEVASSVFAGKGACSGAMTKSMQAKTVLPLRDTGEYVLEIRDATADLAGEDFRYRLQVRPQVPHIGGVSLDAEVVNLRQGEAKTMRVTFDREEGYQGAIVVAVESLPPGISAAAAGDFEPEKDPPAAVGKPERYRARTERVVVAISAAEDAPLSDMPHEIRIVARPLVDGRPGEIVFSRTIPMMVLTK